MGAFPTPKVHVLFFAQAIDTGGVLAKIHERLDNQLMALGVEHEARKFDAHLLWGVSRHAGM